MKRIPRTKAYRRRGLGGLVCERRRIGNGGAKGKVTFCRCGPCAVFRYIAVRRAGVQSDHPAAVLSRAVSENA